MTKANKANGIDVSVAGDGKYDSPGKVIINSDMTKIYNRDPLHLFFNYGNKLNPIYISD